MVYEGSNKTYDFRKFKTIRVFGNEIRNHIINRTMENGKMVYEGSNKTYDFIKFITIRVFGNEIRIILLI